MSSRDLLTGGGEMGALIRALDWSKTPVGPVSAWPQSLRTTISIMLASKFPMYVAWGEQFTQFYNDGYRPILGSTKHPAAMGRSTRETFAEIWHIIGPMFDGVMRGEAVGVVDYLLPLDRHGFVEECYFTFSYSPIRDESGGVGGVLVTVSETTGRVLGERRLRVLRDMARAAQSPNEIDACRTAAEALERRDIPFALIYLLDADGSGARLAARTGEIDAARNAADHVDLEDTVSRWPLASVVASRRATVVEGSFGIARDDIGEVAITRAVVLPIARPGDSRPAGVLVAGISPRLIFDDGYGDFLDLVADAIATAVADIRALEKTRARAEALAELDRAKTAFFSNVSHEFRTPLTLMLGPLDDLMRKRLDGETGELITVAHRSALRLLKLVNTLLEFSRIEAGRIEAVYEPIALETLTADLASVFRSAVERAGVRFDVACEAIGEPVYIDREMWEKVVLNLLSNALKFTFEGSIRVSLRREGEAAVLRVSDTGTGIPAHELPNLFTRFHRIRGARARSHEGTGIGLALVQELTRLHGGSVDVQSEEEKGSTFTVRIPLGRSHLPADRIEAPRNRASAAIRADAFVEDALQWVADLEPLPPPATATKSGRILLADDNADMRHYVRRLLSDHWEVEAVADGSAALAAAMERRPDLVLADVMMPGLDGFELLRELRARAETRGTPVILLSARAGDEARVEGIDAGADDYLVKPFSARELVARVRTHIDLARARETAAGREHALRQAAEQTSERFRTILRSITDGFYSLDHDWTITFVNAQGAAIVGFDPEELVGRNLWEAFPEAVGGRFHDTYFRARRENRTIEVEDYYPPLRKWLQAIAYPSPEGLSVILRDVTARVEAEELIRQRDLRQMEMLQMLTRASVAINSELSLDEMLNAITEAARQIVGTRQATTTLSDKESQKSGWLSAPLRSRTGRHLGVIRLAEKVGGDFNEQDQAILLQLAQLASVAVENAELYQELQSANQAKDEFLATLSHELRTPMTATLGWASLLRLGELSHETVRTAIESIEQSTKAQSRLIEDILDVSRISTGKLQLHFDDVEIASALAAALETIRPVAAAKRIELRIETSPSRHFIRGDSARLQQIFWNILSNAVKFTPAGGAITVREEFRDGRVSISFTDTGEGITADFLPHVFDQFRQAVEGSKRHHGGLGLGLAIARNLAEAQGGTITASSSGPGRGATFTVEFPLIRDAAAEEAEAAGAATGATPLTLRNLSILLVEDQRETRAMLTVALRKFGADVTPTSSVSEAIRRLRVRRPDLIVSDVAMPSEDGYDLIRQIRAMEDADTARIPVIALTALASAEDRRHLLAAGFNAHATKPIDPHHLAEIIIELGNARRLP